MVSLFLVIDYVQEKKREEETTKISLRQLRAGGSDKQTSTGSLRFQLRHLLYLAATLSKINDVMNIKVILSFIF